ncbi:MAG: ABC transporter substrate-binding protein [Candidatus Velthaea sp.]
MNQHVSRRTALAAVGGALLVPRAAFAQPRVTTITTAGLPEDSATPVLYGIGSGAFKRAGLEVTLQAQRSGPAVASGVAGGAYQIGKVSLNPLIDAHAKGIPFVIVAPGGLSTAANPIAGLMVRVDSPIKTAADLNGKTIAVSTLRGELQVASSMWIDKNGGDVKSVHFVELPFAAMAAALKSNRVDAAMLTEPLLTTQKDDIEVLAKAYDAIADEFLIGGFVAATAWTQANPDAARRFVAAMAETARWANTHHAQTADMLGPRLKVDPAVVRTMVRATYGERLNADTIQPVLDAAAKYGSLRSAMRASELMAAA